ACSCACRDRRGAGKNVPADIPPAPHECPLLGVKQTWRGVVSMSANDPKRTFVGNCDQRDRANRAQATCPLSSARPLTSAQNQTRASQLAEMVKSSLGFSRAVTLDALLVTVVFVR